MPHNRKPGFHLIVAGNRNIDAFANTLRAGTNHWRDPCTETVHLIRTKTGEDKDMPDWRKLCYDLLPSLSEYNEVAIPNTTAYATVLPRLLRQLVTDRNIDRDLILVDMTNGTKTWCDFIYLICTVMSITNIFRVKAPKEVYSIPFKDVDVELLAVQFEPVLGQDALQRIVRSTYSEYVFYLREITEFVDWIRMGSCIVFDHNQLYERLLRAFEHYMRANHDACIISIATVLEELLDEMFRIMEHRFRSHWIVLINNRRPSSSLGSKAHSLGQACTRINYLVSGIENGFTRSQQGQSIKKLKETSEFAPLISVGMFCQSLAMIRNYSGHGNPYSAQLQTETDARQMLHGILYIFGKMRICKLFGRD